MKLMINYLKPYSGRMSLGLLIKFSGTIMDLLLPWILAYIIDEVIPLENISRVIQWGVIMVICSIVALITNIIANRMASRVARDGTKQIRHDLFEKISYLSANQIDEYGIPSLISRLTSDTYNVHHTIGMMQRIGVRAPILLLGGILVTLTLDPVLTLVLLAVMPFIALTVYVISKKGIPLFTQLQQEVDQLVRTVRENITGARVIKALSKMDYEKKRFENVNETVVAAETKANVTMAATPPLMNLFLNIGLTLVILVSAFRVNEGLTQPGTVIAFLTYFTIILNAMLSITRIFVIISRGVASADRIRLVLNMKPDLVIQPQDYLPTDDHVAFDHVSFSYHRGRDTLQDIHFSLKKGETLGIIGATGSGKTTIIKLLLRLYDVDKGTIRINGMNIKSIPFEKLHTTFGIVFQKDILFAETIAENIDFGRGLPADEISRSSSFAQADEFIDSLAKGYDYQLNAKGTNLSGGQKQRVLVSRALAGDPEILILDDSSSALDYKTDALLRKAMRKHFKKTTTIIIAQRISSIRHADHILVLDHGRMLGYGTHEELLENCESYLEINESQMGGENIAG